jgi:hypothetical protein
MARRSSRIFRSAITAIFLLSIYGCGGHTTAGIAPFPGRINLSPTGSISVQAGAIFNFNASAVNAAGGNVNTAFTWASNDSSVLNISPAGAACAGQWNATYTACTAGNFGPVTVTASALGATSEPTLVFVHPPIDNLTVTGVLLTGIPIQEPCLSQGQTMTIEAHAFSQGTDISSFVGPFTWSANNSSVVKITPITNNVVYNNFTFNVATNQATVTAANPGLTQIYASASGAFSTVFQQPQYQYNGVTSPVLDFFETCNIQNVALELGPAGNQQTTQTSFTTVKGTPQNVTAVVTDIMGASSLPNTVGEVVLSKIPLTWTASQPADIATGAGCTLSCGLSTPAPGSGSVTASCSPPTCNIGFPYVPASLSSQTLINSCNNFFQAEYPQFAGCSALIPVPVYARPPCALNSNGIGCSTPPPPPLVGAITGLVTGTPNATSVLATSTGCASVPPDTCSSAIYSFPTSKGIAGSAISLPDSPNSLLFDLAGDRAYMGSEFGALQVTPSNFNSSNNPFSSLGTVNGRVLAVSNNGTSAVFSDTVHTPNQVYVVNSGNSNSVSAQPFNISEAVTAGYSPDGLKAFIVGDSGTSLYVYSTLQALQGPISLSEPANSVAFSPNGAFVFLAEGYPTSGGANLTAYSVCDNSLAGTVSLPAYPLFMKVLPAGHIDGNDSSGASIPDGIHIFILDSTGFDVITASVGDPVGSALCPQTLTFAPIGLQRVELNHGTIQPVNFFASADNSLLYIPVLGDSSVLVYSFETGGATGGILLQGNATPLSASMTADASAILIAGSDGMVHQINTLLGGSDSFPVTFPDLPNVLDPFCTFVPSSGPCSLNLVAVRP